MTHNPNDLLDPKDEPIEAISSTMFYLRIAFPQDEEYSTDLPDDPQQVMLDFVVPPIHQRTKIPNALRPDKSKKENKGMQVIHEIQDTEEKEEEEDEGKIETIEEEQKEDTEENNKTHDLDHGEDVNEEPEEEKFVPLDSRDIRSGI